MEDYANHHLPPQQSQEPETDLDIEQNWQNDVSASDEKTTTSTPPTTTTTTREVTTEEVDEEEEEKNATEQLLLEQKRIKSSKTTQMETVQKSSSSAKKKGAVAIEDKLISNSTEDSELVPTTIKPFRRKNLHTYPTDAYVTQAPPPEG